MQLTSALSHLNATALSSGLDRSDLHEVNADTHPVTVREEAESKRDYWRRDRGDTSKQEQYWASVVGLADEASLNGEVRGV